LDYSYYVVLYEHVCAFLKEINCLKDLPSQ
jgi:hypothetical protein